MPPPTALQQALGTGGTVKRDQGFGSALLSQQSPGQGVATPGVDESWSRMFGPATSTNLLEQRQVNSGQMPTVGSPQPQLSSTTPEAASTTNAMQPGAFNGNTENGFSSTQQAGGESNNERGTTSPIGAALMSPDIQPAVEPVPPPLAPPIEPPQPPMAPPAAPPPDDAAAFAGMAPDVIEPLAQSGESPARIGVTGQVSAPAADVPSKVSFGGMSFATTKPPPANWASMTDAQRMDWVKANSVQLGQAIRWSDYQMNHPGQGGAGGVGGTGGEPIISDAPIGAADGTMNKTGTPGQNYWDNLSIDDASAIINGTGPSKNWWGSFWSGVLGLGPNAMPEGASQGLPHPNQYHGPIVTVSSPAELTAALNAQTGITDPRVAKLLGWAASRSADLATAIQQGNEDPAVFRSGSFIALSRKVELCRQALAQYGVTFDPMAYAKIQLGGNGDQTGVTPNATDSYYDEEGRFHLQRVPQYYSGDSVSKFAKSIGMDFGSLNTQQKQAMFELQQQLDMAKRGMGAQDTAYQNSSDTMEANLNDPAFLKFQQAALDYGDNGMPLDWNTKRNQYVSDQDKLGENIVQGVSTGAARRGLDAGAVQGMQSDLLRANANDTSRGLGDLRIKESEDRRSQKLTGLALLQGSATMGAGLRSGGDAARNQILMGAPPTAANPLAGLTNTGLALFGTQQSYNAYLAAMKEKEDAGDFGWDDAGQMGISALASFFGASV